MQRKRAAIYDECWLNVEIRHTLITVAFKSDMDCTFSQFEMSSFLSVQLGGNSHVDSASQKNEDKTLNFVLIDGTWSNSAAMFRRLKVMLGSISLFTI